VNAFVRVHGVLLAIIEPRATYLIVSIVQRRTGTATVHKQRTTV